VAHPPWLDGSLCEAATAAAPSGPAAEAQGVRQRDDAYETQASDSQDQVGQEGPDAPLPG